MPSTLAERYELARPHLCRYKNIITIFSIFFFILFVIACIEWSTYSRSTSYWSEEDYFQERCEKVPINGRWNRFLRQPANALSNLAFVLAGLYCTVAAWFDWNHFGRDHHRFSVDAAKNASFLDRATSRPRRNSITRMAGGLVLHPLLSLCVAFGLYFVGYGSFYYHAAAGSSLGGWFDITGIFILCIAVLFLALYGVSAVFTCSPSQDKITAALCVVGCIICWFVFGKGWDKPPLWMGSWEKEYMFLITFLGSMVGTFIFLVLIVHGVFRLKAPIRFIVLSLLALVVAVVAWVPEEIQHKCIYPFGGGSGSWFQLHGLWHALLAVCIFWLFAYVRSIGMCPEVLATFNMDQLDFWLLREKYRGVDEHRRSIADREGEFEMGATSSRPESAESRWWTNRSDHDVSTAMQESGRDDTHALALDFNHFYSDRSASAFV